MLMKSGSFEHYHHLNYYCDTKEPVILSWLNALHEARRRTVSALDGLNPWDGIVELLREKYQLLIGSPTAQRLQWQLKEATSESPATLTVKGRNMITGLPAAIEISSTEVRDADNSQATQPYMDWSPEENSSSIGMILYAIAANEGNYLYVGMLQQSPPQEIERLFERDPEKVFNFVRGQTLAQHYRRLEWIRTELEQAYCAMSFEVFQKGRLGKDVYCSPEWVIHHLCQFEAERRAEISILLNEAKRALKPQSKQE